MLTGLAGAAVSGISNILGNVLGKKSQKDTNEANLKINQMNNEFNAREAEKAFQRESQYNDKVRAEDRAFNSAKAQVERYREAGLNPALMMSGQSAGMAQSNGVGSSAASASIAAPQEAFRPEFGILGSAIEGFLNRRQQQELIHEQVNGLRIENQYKAQKIMAEIADLRTKKLTNEAKAKLDNTIESLAHNQYQIQRDMADSTIAKNREESKLIVQERLLKQEEVRTFAQKFGEESAIRLAQETYIAVETSKSRREAQHEVFKKIETQYRTKGLQLDNRLAQRMADALVDKAYNEAHWSQYDPRYTGKYGMVKDATESIRNGWNKLIN